jgi:endo-1,3-1,4-beta-glycanase ExoK
MSWMRVGRFSCLLPCLALACEESGASTVATGGTGATANQGGGTGGTESSGGASSVAGSGAGSGSAGSAGAGGGSGGTVPATAGSAGAAGTGGAGGAPAESFTLLFRDDFDQLDLARWQLMTHSWDTNLALFGDDAVTVEAGQLVLSLLPAPEGTVDTTNAPKSFLGAEVRSTDTLTFGRVRARVRFASGSAVVSSLVTIYTPWPADDWNELDIEVLGKAPVSTQFNTMVYSGPPTTPPVTESVVPTQFPQKVDLGFDPSSDFHVYEIEWTPVSVRFLVDEVPVHTWTEQIERMKLPQNVLLTIWASSSAAWAGAVTAETGTAKAYYDWIELYRLGP